jgi:hypothetical protein
VPPRQSRQLQGRGYGDSFLESGATLPCEARAHLAEDWNHGKTAADYEQGSSRVRAREVWFALDEPVIAETGNQRLRARVVDAVPAEELPGKFDDLGTGPAIWIAAPMFSGGERLEHDLLLMASRQPVSFSALPC